MATIKDAREIIEWTVDYLSDHGYLDNDLMATVIPKLDAVQAYIEAHGQHGDKRRASRT